MSQFRKHPVERALEIAKTGAYRSRSEIARAMEREGYTMADVNQLEGTSLTRQLNGLCKLAKAQASDVPPRGSAAKTARPEERLAS